MRDVGTVILILLFAVGFVLYVGSDGQYGAGVWKLIDSLKDMDIASIVNLVKNSLKDYTNIAGLIGIGIFSYVTTRSVSYMGGILVLSGLAQILFLPFTTYKQLPLPSPFDMLIHGFFNLLLLIAVISFITDKEW